MHVSEESTGSDRKRSLWTSQELDVLREMYPSDKFILEEVERRLPAHSRNAISCKASELGLRRPILEVPEELQKPSPSLELDMSKLVTKIDTNSVYYLLKAIKLIVYTTNSTLDTLTLPELVADIDTNLEQVGKILSTRDLRRTAWHFLDYGASTALILQNRVGISHAASYRYLKDLMTFKFIVPAVRTRGEKGKRGPKTDVWMVPDATIDMINEAQALHRRLMSPKYVTAERLGQLILEEYLAPRQATEINYREITIRMKELKMSFTTPDIADLAAQYLHEKGIKVWR